MEILCNMLEDELNNPEYFTINTYISQKIQNPYQLKTFFRKDYQWHLKM